MENMPSETEALKKIARAIITRGPLTVTPEKPVRWASGYFMPIYLDNRCLLGHSDIRKIIAETFAGIITRSGEHYDAIAGVATGGIPHATTLADMLDLPLLYIRGSAKDHGTGRLVEGEIPGGIDGKKVLVLEDVVSMGGSAAQAVEAVRAIGAIVPNCFSLFSYDFKDAQLPFSKLTPPCVFSPLVTFPFLIEVARAEKILPESVLATLEEWHSNPFAWGDAHGYPKQ